MYILENESCRDAIFAVTGSIIGVVSTYASTSDIKVGMMKIICFQCRLGRLRTLNSYLTSGSYGIWISTNTYKVTHPWEYYVGAVWSFSISLSPTAQHWDSPPSCPEWPPSGSRHSWRSNTGFTRSQCCIWHDWPLHTLESSFGIQGKALDWFHSYLTGRTQTVHIKKSTSEPHELQYGVPQGSVLGPILFTIYTTPLGELIRRHGLTFHLYADDTQLYLTFKPSEPSSINNIISQLENCIEDIRAWMKLNLLKLNDDKTEMLVITSRPSTSQSLNISVKVGDQYINPSDEPPKNLGVIFDSTCSLKDHVANVCRSINFNLYSIGKIRKYLDRPTVEKLVNATITSRLDYCNSLMFGIPKDLMSQLQKRQNHAARVITQWRKYDHITPVLVDLHWLPVKQRIDFKILLLTYKALNGLAPAYIRELLTPYTPVRTLRSMDNNLLEPPKCRLEYFGKRSFAAAAPVLWNDLPLHIKQSPSVDIFKSRIKTRLFQLAYFIWLCKCMYVYFMLSRVGWGKGLLRGQTPSADFLEIMWPGESRDSSSETLRKQRLLHERGAR